METHNIPLLTIVGQTATGKTDLAISLAKQLDGEIICADSRTVYRGMSIGTAKPSSDDQARARHYGLDLVDPDETFTAADFKNYATDCINEIAGRGKLPILVGGSGLYVDGVLYDYEFLPPADSVLRARLSKMSVAELQQEIMEQGLTLPNGADNPRHLMRTLETGGRQPTRRELRPNTLVIGLQASRQVLQKRITARVDAMVTADFVAELTQVSQQYGWQANALRAPGYKAFREYLEGTKSLEQAKADFVRNDLQLAKRQLTWFRRNKSIHWLGNRDNLAEAVDIATTFLHN